MEGHKKLKDNIMKDLHVVPEMKKPLHLMNEL